MNLETTYLDRLDPETSNLLSKLLCGEVENSSEQDKSLLIKNKKEIIEYLNTIFAAEIPLLEERNECNDGDRLYWAFKVAEFLESTEAFPWVLRICRLSEDPISQSLGIDFITEDLAYLIAHTLSDWAQLKDIIEDASIGEFIRSACLDALLYYFVKKGIEREELIDYFKSLFHRILSGEMNDIDLCTHLISSCTDFWPGECLEEIKEAFGLDLVHDNFIDIENVLSDWKSGKDRCIEKLQKKLQSSNIFEIIEDTSELPYDMKHLNFENLLKSIDQARTYADLSLGARSRGSQRNELCGCGSGRKYKKCCLDKHSLKNSSDIMIEETTISYEPLDDEENPHPIPQDAKEFYHDFYKIASQNPEFAIKKSLENIEKYPDVPAFYNHLHAAYCLASYKYEAIRLVKEMIQQFPNYLFARIEYAHYFLRRGEPDNAYDALGNKGTLAQLYPERTVFHISELRYFSYVMALYHIQKGDIDQAKIYLEVIKKAEPNNHHMIKSLHKKFMRVLMPKFMDNLKKN